MQLLASARHVPESMNRFGRVELAQPGVTEKRLMKRALVVSQSSKDTSTKVGAVIVTPRGRVLLEDFNHFPPGIDEAPPERWERPAKYQWVGHAEVNAIYQAAQKGVALAGSRMVINWFPCIPCAKAIISTGIKEIIGFTPDYQDPRWGEDFKFVKKLLDEAKIKLRLFSKADYLQ